MVFTVIVLFFFILCEKKRRSAVRKTIPGPFHRASHRYCEDFTLQQSFSLLP